MQKAHKMHDFSIAYKTVSIRVSVWNVREQVNFLLQKTHENRGQCDVVPLILNSIIKVLTAIACDLLFACGAFESVECVAPALGARLCVGRQAALWRASVGGTIIVIGHQQAHISGTSTSFEFRQKS